MKKKLFVSFLAISIMLVLNSFSVADTGIPRGKSAAAGLLPDELKSMKIEDYFVESKGSPAGSVQSATGQVVVVHKDTNRAYFAATGDAVYQQDVFYTLKDSRCRIKFSTEDIITMGENSKVVADEIVDDRISKEKKSSISMLKGKAMFYVVRLFKYKKVSASVKTPTAVMGVRGTKFGVDVRKVGEKVADLSDNSFIYLAQNETGNFETVVYGFEGTVDVTSTADGSTQTVGAGENLVLDNTGAGNVEQTDPNAANQFIGETEGGDGTGGSGGGDGDTGGGTEGGGETGDTGALDDNSAEDIAQNLTSLVINEQSPSTGVLPLNKMGYFTAMLTYNPDGYYNNGVFVSSTLQDLNGTGIADDIVYNHRMTVNGLAGDAGELVSVEYSDGYGGYSGGITGPYPVSRTYIGNNAYMEWGYWTRTDPMLDNFGDDIWIINNSGYYIAGDYTPDISALNQAWTYSGEALGTYWIQDTSTSDQNSGINMTGTFSADVNFAMTSGQITNFYLNVSDSVTSNNVIITGAGGSFAGASSHFEISGGSWSISGSTAESTAGYGSVYGPNAEAMGGVWGVKAPPDGTPYPQYATGIFHGTR